MGYYSNFNIQVISKEKFSINELIKELDSIANYVDFSGLMENSNPPLIESEDENMPKFIASDSMDKTTEFCFDVFDLNWYDCEENFIALSKKFPNLNFFITRYGEGTVDIEEMYIINGKSQTQFAELIFPKWDENTEKIFEKNRYGL